MLVHQGNAKKKVNQKRKQSFKNNLKLTKLASQRTVGLVHVKTPWSLGVMIKRVLKSSQNGILGECPLEMFLCSVSPFAFSDIFIFSPWGRQKEDMRGKHLNKEISSGFTSRNKLDNTALLYRLAMQHSDYHLIITQQCRPWPSWNLKNAGGLFPTL